MNSRGSTGPIQSLPGGFTETAIRSCALNQISISFSETSMMPLPTTTHSRSRSEPGGRDRAAGVDAPHDEADVVSDSPRSWPELPAATMTARPDVVSAASIQRVTAALPSCACPLVARLTLMETGFQRLAELQEVVDRVGQSARVVERQAPVLVLPRQRDQDAGNRPAPPPPLVRGTRKPSIGESC